MNDPDSRFSRSPSSVSRRWPVGLPLFEWVPRPKRNEGNQGSRRGRSCGYEGCGRRRHRSWRWNGTLRSQKAIEKLAKTLEGDLKTGAQIVRRVVEEPARMIAHNAGHDGAIVVARYSRGEQAPRWVLTRTRKKSKTSFRVA